MKIFTRKCPASQFHLDSLIASRCDEKLEPNLADSSMDHVKIDDCADDFEFDVRRGSSVASASARHARPVSRIINRRT